MRMQSILAAAVVLAAPLFAQSPAIDPSRVHEDAKVMRRVLEVSKKDLPRDILSAIAREDLEILRGRHTDTGYLWASHEREEGGKIAEGFTIAAGQKPTTLRHRGDYVYKLTAVSPGRRYLVRKNQRVLIERIDMDLSPIGNAPARVETLEVNEWLDPGAKSEFELPIIARVARITVLARTEETAGPAGLELALSVAKLTDDPLSPYSRAVENLKLVLQRVEKGDRENLRTLANQLAADPALAAGQRTDIVTAPTFAEPGYPDPLLRPSTPSATELYIELQTIEDLLTGSPEERREGMDTLHQLIRMLRAERQ